MTKVLFGTASSLFLPYVSTDTPRFQGYSVLNISHHTALFFFAIWNEYLLQWPTRLECTDFPSVPQGCKDQEHHPTVRTITHLRFGSLFFFTTVQRYLLDMFNQAFYFTSPLGNRKNAHCYLLVTNQIQFILQITKSCVDQLITTLCALPAYSTLERLLY